MSLHDAYARRTPFEIAFPDRTVVDRLAADVSAEAVRHGADDSRLEVFVAAASAAALAREMQAPGAPPEAGYPLAALLYHAVHFLRAGAPLHLLSSELTRRLTEPDWRPGGSTAEATPEPPSSAGYLQLPQHLLWTAGGRRATSEGDRSSGSTSPGGAAVPPPESIDGLFWTVSGSGELNVLPVSGLLPDRPGFAALPLPPAPLADADLWLEARMRASADDFASTLPGSEIDRLRSVETAGELLKLIARFFAVVGSARAGAGGVRLERRDPAAAEPEGAPGPPPPSMLPYTRASLTG